MKLFTIIFALYIFALNLVPCEDYGSLDNEVNTEISKSGEHDHNHQDSDMCSPFCQCQCCHVYVIHVSIADYKVSDVAFIEKSYFYEEGFEKEFNTSLLEPPKV
ncbi:DUF6660 family protein [Tenacibaculum amylolyticum]|uniref:DUF6660 family protein n=1 Tax=Tenacibaculum amylolyticum TaxID=104269 RepID=UPI003894247E